MYDGSNNKSYLLRFKTFYNDKEYQDVKFHKYLINLIDSQFAKLKKKEKFVLFENTINFFELNYI